jgi:hypothetical protein
MNPDAHSPEYGKVVASVAVPGPDGSPHHTEAHGRMDLLGMLMGMERSFQGSNPAA